MGTAGATAGRKAVLFGAFSGAGTGNTVTAERIARILTQCGCDTKLVNVGDRADAVDAVRTAFASAGGADLFIGVHAYRAGAPILDAGLVGSRPVILILGGTDVNEDIAAGGSAAKQAVIARVLLRADAVVAFTHAMAERYRAFARSALVADARAAATLPMTLPASAPAVAAAAAGAGDADAVRAVEWMLSKLHVVPQAIDLVPCAASPPRCIAAPPASSSTAAAATAAATAAAAPVAAAAAAAPLAAAPAGDDLRAALRLPRDAIVLLLVAGLRRVKDPLHLASAVAAWHNAIAAAAPPAACGCTTAAADDAGGCGCGGGGGGGGGSCHWRQVYLAIVGPVLDPAVGAAVLAAAGAGEGPAAVPPAAAIAPTAGAAAVADDALRHAGVPTTVAAEAVAAAAPPLPLPLPAVVYHPPVAQPVLWSWMRQADVVLNTSISEGQSAAVLEALALGCVVVARRNEGNAAVVAHGETGFLYSDPEEAVVCCKRVTTARSCSVQPAAVPLAAGGCADADDAAAAALRQRVSAAAVDYCSSHHGVAAETAAWRSILAAVGSGGGSAMAGAAGVAAAAGGAASC